jgi:tRNA pseudouridine38-40 synthase
MRYFAEISYRGTQYNGWQMQPNTPKTVQEKLNYALGLLLRHEIETVAGGRTDTGVHCLSQFVHFDTENMPEISQFLHKLNLFLPKDIHVKQILRVKTDAHARYDGISRTYEYHINTEKNPFAEDLSLYYYKNLDIDLMNQAANLLQQHTDFECFSKVKTAVKHFNCTIYQAEWVVDSKNIVFHIKANRFLRGMVRAIVGTLLDVGSHKTTIQDFENIILSKKRTQAGKNVSPYGLFLTEIAYKNEIFEI